MLDWYYFLFFGAGLLIYCLEIVVSHRSVADYFSPTVQYGIGKGTVLIWAVFFSGGIFEMAFFSSVAFGLGISITYWIAFYILAYLLLSKCIPLAIKQAESENIRGLPDIYSSKFAGKGRNLSFIILLLVNLDGLIIQPTIALWLFRTLFDTNGLLFISLLVSFCVIISGLGGIGGISRAVKILMIVTGAALVFLPIYLYVIKGIEHVYQLYSNWSFIHVVDLQDGFVFTIILINLVCLKISTSLFIWRVLLSLKRPHFSSAIKLAVAGSASFSISLLVYFVYISSQYFDSDWLPILRSFTENQGDLLLSVAVFIWFITAAHSIIFSIYSINSLAVAVVEQFSRKLATTKKVYLFSMIAGAMSVAFANTLMGHSLQIIFIYLLFSASMSIPSMALLLRKGILPSWIPIVMLSTPTGTVAFYCFYDSFALSLYIGLISSIFLGLVIYYFDFSEKDKMI
ncbi:hypothetical protein [Bacillus sp. V5-8f]|uniref:hypothetical protein n=1 Tax=Bacillus sp. V5-8f TaxID=2053044 RepID=UPI000C77F405|nr:hypothetical protein [Bacillus sp. V5-8f]PLT35517.1 hypothetical protein CUU64_02605 [Bacillus sp. V5-8f]